MIPGLRRGRVAWWLAVAAFACLRATNVSAQVVIDPEYVEFDASPDHSAVTSMGSPAVQDYELALYFPGSSVPVVMASLGKPTPSGKRIRVRFLPLLPSAPTPGVTFEARVIAVGPGGRTASPASNQFSFGSACSYAASPGAVSIPTGGGTGAIALATAAGCAWTASSSATWLTLTTAPSGKGPATITVEAEANTGSSARSATLTIGGETVTVSQAGVSCTYTVSPATATVSASGGNGTATVSTTAGCTWSASSSASWLTVTSGATGSGTGTIGYSAAVNAGSAQRSATIAAGGRTLTVTQPGVPCTYGLSASSAVMAATASSGSVALTTVSGCPWTASSSVSWLTVTSAASGIGPATITFEAAANTGSAPRAGAVAVGGQTLSVTQQAAGSCTYTVTPTVRTLAAAGATGSLTVTAAAGCAWTASSNAPWLTLATASGLGSGTITYTASANPATTARSVQVSAGGKMSTLTQTGASCSYSLSPSSASVSWTPTVGSFDMTAPAGCLWGAYSNALWLRVTSTGTNNGSGKVTFTTTTNVSSSPRTATISAAGKSVTVTQAGGSACTYELSADRVVVGRAATEGSLLVTVTGGCPLVAASSASWITVKSIDVLTGTVTYDVAANPGTTTRVGILQIGNAIVTVTQRTTTAPLAPGGLAVKAQGGGK